MVYTIPGRMKTVRTITRAAEQTIRTKTGMRVSIMLCPDDHIDRTPEQLLRRVASALDMQFADFSRKTRKRDIVELRFIAGRLLRQFFPNITLQQISAYFGGQDHTSVLNGLTRAQMLLDAADPRFTEKHRRALTRVNNWLRKDGLNPTPALSA